MLQNVGLLDRIVRWILAAGLAVAAVVWWSNLWWLLIVAAVLLITGLVGYCPIWHVFRVKTNKETP